MVPQPDEQAGRGEAAGARRRLPRAGEHDQPGAVRTHWDALRPAQTPAAGGPGGCGESCWVSSCMDIKNHIATSSGRFY